MTVPEPVPGGDRSNGWEAVAPWFVRYSRTSTIGVRTLQAWAGCLPVGAAVLDLGCGPGSPRSDVLHDAGFDVFAIDAAPTLAASYAARYPRAPVACEPAEDSTLFGSTFDAVLAWGLVFLLPAETQRRVIHRVARALKPGGRFLFTAPAQVCTWSDASTGRPSWSIGREAYAALLSEAGLTLLAEQNDEGDNHYYEAGAG